MSEEHDELEYGFARMPETTLVPPAFKALETIRALECVNRTDAVNRALQGYAQMLELREQGLIVAGVGQPRGLLRRRQCIGLRWNNPFHDDSPTED